MTSTFYFPLENEAAEIGVLGEVADVLMNIGGVDFRGLAAEIRRLERQLVEHTLHHGLQAPRADVLDRAVDRDRDVGERVDRVAGELDVEALEIGRAHV